MLLSKPATQTSHERRPSNGCGGIVETESVTLGHCIHSHIRVRPPLSRQDAARERWRQSVNTCSVARTATLPPRGEGVGGGWWGWGVVWDSHMKRSGNPCSQPSIFSLGVKPANRGSREIWTLAQEDAMRSLFPAFEIFALQKRGGCEQSTSISIAHGRGQAKCLVTTTAAHLAAQTAAIL